MTLTTAIDIAAPVSRVWDVLTDFPAYTQWNPFITSIVGNASPRLRLRVRIHPPGGRALVFKPVVLRVEPERELAWRGRTIVPGLFDGEHVFLLERRGAATHFVHQEHFSGMLVPLLRGSLSTATRQGFEAMNAALKARAEHAA